MIPLVKVSFRSNIFGIRYLLPICSTMPVNILGLVFTVRSLIAGMYKLQCRFRRPGLSAPPDFSVGRGGGVA